MNIDIIVQPWALLTGLFATAPVGSFNCIYMQGSLLSPSTVQDSSGKLHAKSNITGSPQATANGANFCSLTKQGEGQNWQSSRDARDGAYSKTVNLGENPNSNKQKNL